MPDWLIAAAEEADLPAVVALVNSAYRGDSSKAGWTTEADYLDGQRTSLADLKAELAAPSRPTLLALRREAGGEILACALVEPLAKPDYLAVYLGMVTVSPTLQASGLGRAMLEAGEAHGRAIGAARARITVVSIREALIAWYLRRGYALTGERQPFPYDDARFGIPKRPDLEFVVLEKPL